VPGSRLLLSGIKIPFWKDILALAVRAQEVSGLGFLGADVAIDRERGPVFLELNARPGLSIQLANRAGLAERMERVAGLTIKTAEKGVRVGMDLFGGEIEEELEEISGRKVIGPVEKVKLIGTDGKEAEVEAKIDTGAFSSSIDAELAKELGFTETLEAFGRINLLDYELTPENESIIKKDIIEKHGQSIPDLEDIAVVFSASGSSIRPVVKLSFTLNNLTVDAKVNVIDRKNMKYPIIIGKKNLSKFLIDVSKVYERK
jgi:hypothetical protein